MAQAGSVGGPVASLARRMARAWPAWLVLGIGLLLSLLAWQLTERRVNAEAAAEFERKADEAVEAIDRRVQENVNLLLGLKGLFGASELVSRDEFHLYLTGLRLEQRYDFVRILSFSRYVRHEQRAAYEARMRREGRGRPGYAIKPPGAREDYVVVEYFEPTAGNEAALGVDIAADPLRRAEVARARDTGEPVASAPFAPTISPSEISVALRVAAYRRGLPTDTASARREAFVGALASVIHVGSLMEGLFGNRLSSEFDLVAHDVGPWSAGQPQAPTRGNLLYDSRRRGGAGTEAGTGPFHPVAMIEVAGRRWRLAFSLPAGGMGVEGSLPAVVLLGGIVTSLLLFWIVWTLIISRDRALRLAEQARAVTAAGALREQLAFIQRLIEAVPQPIFFKDAAGHYLGVNSAWEAFFGIPRGQFIGKSVFELYPNNPELAKKHDAKDRELYAGPGSQSYEAAIIAADGRVHHTIYNKAVFHRSDGTAAGLIGTITDVTELKETEAALRESEARFRGLTELSTDWYWEQDAAYRFTRIEGRAAGTHPVARRDFLVGKALWETGAEPLEGGWDDCRRRLDARAPFHDFETRVTDAAGQEHFLSTSGRPFFDADGAFRGYRGSARDITARKREERLLRLEHSVTRCLSEAGSATQGLTAVIRTICEIMGWPCGRYFAVDAAADVLRFSAGWGVTEPAVERFLSESRAVTYRRGEGLSGKVWQSGAPLWSREASNDARASGTSRRIGGVLGGALVFPVISQGATIGVLSVSGHESREPDERLLDTIRVIGSQIGQFLQRKQAEEVLQKSEARFRDLTELSSDWYWEQNENLRFTQMSSKIEEFSFDAAEHIGKTRWEVPVQGVSPEQWTAHKAVLEAREPFQDFTYQRLDSNGNLRTISVSGRPIFDEAGRFCGYRGTGRDVTERRQIEERIRHMAHHDALTQLPNRALLHDRIAQAIAQAQRNRETLALLFIDLDRFKTVNDSLGHAVGDLLLKAVAERLVACTRGSDTIARIGGDEFVVLLGGLDQPEDARHVAQKILEAMAQPITVDGHELRVTPSIGICAYPHDGEDVDSLMRNADTAMYHAKQMGRNNYQFFTPAMNEAAQERLRLENDLRNAVERGEFVLHYQPQIDLKTGAIAGFESLLRWQHPQRGLVAPAQFVAAAEETGLIVPIGEWVLRESCAQARAWHDAGHRALLASVNCSAHQFQRADFVDTVRRALRETGLPAGRLELEITESVIIQRSEDVIARFQTLDELGASIAIDDFGTGYSGLSYLKRFAVHRLKIDRSFVGDIGSDPDDAAIVSAIIAIAHSLGLQVVAEGVETAEQLAFLESLGCDAAQGYYFSKPVPAAAFAELLESWGRRKRAAAG